MENDRVTHVLNNLIEVSRDGVKGFETCAEGADDPALKSYFTTCAARCRLAVQELQAEVTKYGGDPDHTGSLAGVLHRAWVNVKTAVSRKDNLAVLEECERGEDSALKNYRDALDKDLPVEVRTLIERQYQGVQQNHDRVRQMRDELRHADAAE